MPSFSNSCSVRVLVCLTLISAATVHAGAGESLRVVRVLNPRLVESLNDALRVSPTVRAIVDELEQSDLIVHVHGMGPGSRGQFSGAMRFVHAAGDRRFLRITINDWLPDDQRAAALAHELRHALEVARSGSVVDRASFADLYRRIGYESGGPHAQYYETDDAKRAGAVVLADFRMAASEVRRAVQPGAGNGSR